MKRSNMGLASLSLKTAVTSEVGEGEHMYEAPILAGLHMFCNTFSMSLKSSFIWRGSE
jgi:hypothetical protein